MNEDRQLVSLSKTMTRLMRATVSHRIRVIGCHSFFWIDRSGRRAIRYQLSEGDITVDGEPANKLFSLELGSDGYDKMGSKIISSSKYFGSNRCDLVCRNGHVERISSGIEAKRITVDLLHDHRQGVFNATPLFKKFNDILNTDVGDNYDTFILNRSISKRILNWDGFGVHSSPTSSKLSNTEGGCIVLYLGATPYNLDGPIVYDAPEIPLTKNRSHTRDAVFEFYHPPFIDKYACTLFLQPSQMFALIRSVADPNFLFFSKVTIGNIDPFRKIGEFRST
jgi:hypothetical protein